MSRIDDESLEFKDLSKLLKTYDELKIKCAFRIGDRKVIKRAIPIQKTLVDITLYPRQYILLTLDDVDTNSSACRFYFTLQGKFLFCSVE